jgi:DNA topoisomerase-2
MTNENDELVSLLPSLHPWYRGFTGEIKWEVSKNRYITYGICEKIDVKSKNGKVIPSDSESNSEIEEEEIKPKKGKKKVIPKKKGAKEKYKVSELPVGMWTEKFHDNIKSLLEENKISNIDNQSTDETVDFTLTESLDGMRLSRDNLKLFTYLHISNMNMWDENSVLTSYETVDKIIDNFCKVRYDFYVQRKKRLLSNLENSIKKLKNQHRFTLEILKKTIIIFNTPEEEIIRILEEKKYDKLNKQGESYVKENKEGEELKEETKESFDYLLTMQLRTFTQEKVARLNSEFEKKEKEIQEIRRISEFQMWTNDLDELEKAYRKVYKDNL